MRRNVEKSLCKCRRCVAKRRFRFLVPSGACIAMAAGCYILVVHLKSGAPDSLSMAKPSAEEPDLDASGIPRGTPLLGALAQSESSPENLAEDSFLTGSPELTPNLSPPQRSRVALPSSNPIEGAPMPHANGWQTVPLADALESSSVVNIQGGSQPDGTKVAPMPAESSPGPAFGEPTVHPAAEGLMAYSADPYELLPRWLQEMQQKSDKTSLRGNALVLQNRGNAGGASISAARSTALVAPKSEIPESELDQQLEPQPKKTDVASQNKPNKPLVSESAGNVRAVASETKKQDSKPALSSARLFASPESNAALPAPAEERSKPRGYITVESKPEAPPNPGAEDHHPKSQEHSPRAQDHLLARDRPPIVQEYPSKTPDGPSEPNEKSGDLRHFASAFLQTDQSGNVADQHRFYADSVHFYGEGDLSWAGVEAATRRYRQERQNKRYGTEGTAAVKGPIDGGFYVVEQPVSWTRAEGSRLVRGRSVLRLRVVPTNRGDWKITSIDEIGK